MLPEGLQAFYFDTECNGRELGTGKHCGFRNVLQAPTGGGVAAAEEAAAVVGGHVFAGDLSLTDELGGESGGAAVL
jgi:hypothetical protein